MGKLRRNDARDREVSVGILQAFSTRPFNVLANVSSVAGLVLLVFNGLEWDAQALPLLYLCMLSSALLVRYVRQERWARYAEGVQLMDQAVQQLMVATDRLLYADTATDNEKFLLLLQTGLARFAEAFTLVTGTACRASIKELFSDDVAASTAGGVIEVEENVLQVATMLRHRSEDSRGVATRAPDRVDENTDFSEVLQTHKPFHAGQLDKDWLAGRYSNSHWTNELRTSRDFQYRSAIVWPVKVDPPAGESPEPADRIVAFLCVDSRKRRAFDRKSDISFGGVFAHALYPALYYSRSS